MGGPRGLSSVPVRSLSTQHIGGASSLRSPSVRRMRQLLELTSGPASPSSGLSGHQSPAPTPSTTLPRPHRQIDINPAEFVKYKLDKPGKAQSLVRFHPNASKFCLIFVFIFFLYPTLLKKKEINQKNCVNFYFLFFTIFTPTYPRSERIFLEMSVKAVRQN